MPGERYVGEYNINFDRLHLIVPNTYQVVVAFTGMKFYTPDNTTSLTSLTSARAKNLVQSSFTVEFEVEL